MVEQFPDYDDILRRCCRCNAFKGNDPDNLGAECSDGAYLCPVCKRAVLGDEVKDWPIEWQRAHDRVRELEREVARLRAENEGLRQAVLNAVAADARA